VVLAVAYKLLESWVSGEEPEPGQGAKDGADEGEQS